MIKTYLALFILFSSIAAHAYDCSETKVDDMILHIKTNTIRIKFICENGQLALSDLDTRYRPWPGGKSVDSEFKISKEDIPGLGEQKNFTVIITGIEGRGFNHPQSVLTKNVFHITWKENSISDENSIANDVYVKLYPSEIPGGPDRGLNGWVYRKKHSEFKPYRVYLNSREFTLN